MIGKEKETVWNEANSVIRCHKSYNDQEKREIRDESDSSSNMIMRANKVAYNMEMSVRVVIRY